ncbi:MAG: hypothetical protein ACFBZ8_00325 [Opitutales bacterium]
MNNLTIPCSPTLLAPLNDLVASVVRSMGDELALNANYTSGDAELDAVLESSLIEEMQEDCSRLEAVFRESDNGQGQLVIRLEEGEAILRASSAVRLRLRRTLLRGVPDEVLERGEVDLQNLATLEQRGYMGYVFLANLQEVLVRFMDPGATDAIPEEAEDPFGFETDGGEPDDDPDDDTPFDGKKWG